MEKPSLLLLCIIPQKRKYLYANERLADMASLKRPSVSVALAAYNGEKYLHRQIQSILEQLKEDDELVISLDPSQDQSEELIRSFHDPRIKLLKGPGKGLIKNFENALLHTRNDVIFLSDQDDIWYSNKIQSILPKLKDSILVIHDCRIVDECGKEIEHSFMRFHHSKPGFLRNIIRNSYIGCCMAFKKELKQYILPFPERIPMHDQWIGLIAERKGNVYWDKTILMDYVRHSKNASSLSHASTIQMLNWRIELWKALMKRGVL